MSRYWDFIVDSLAAMFIPLVCFYYTLSSNVFLNVAAKDATGLEWIGDQILTPVHYLLAGKEAVLKDDGNWELKQKFAYESGFFFKAAASIVALPPSIVFGSAIKGLSLLQPKTKVRYWSIRAAKDTIYLASKKNFYEELGIDISTPKEMLVAQGHLRKEGDENVLFEDKKALRDIGEILKSKGILWWIDCGTCLGAYRYGGAIPWDGDIDIAILEPDSENVRHALSLLDSDKYVVQDWSSRTHPNSWYKVFIRLSKTMIDVYHFRIFPETKEIGLVFSYEDHLFFPKWWKIRESRFKAPIAFQDVFPLKKALFDGVEVFVPQNTEKYLQRYYGENLAPVKIFNPKTKTYEKDLSHPYWERPYVH